MSDKASYRENSLLVSGRWMPLSYSLSCESDVSEEVLVLISKNERSSLKKVSLSHLWFVLSNIDYV